MAKSVGDERSWKRKYVGNRTIEDDRRDCSTQLQRRFRGDWERGENLAHTNIGTPGWGNIHLDMSKRGEKKKNQKCPGRGLCQDQRRRPRKT